MSISTAEEIKNFSFLEQVNSEMSSSGRSFVCPYNALQEVPEDEVSSWVEEMLSEGMLHRDDDVTLKVGVTYQGKQYLQNGFCQRQNLTILRGVVKERLLQWTYANSHVGKPVPPSLSSEELWFYGRTITASDLERAARDLSHHGLISIQWSGEDNDLMVGILDEGKQCVELFDGDIDAYSTAGETNKAPFTASIPVVVLTS